MEHFKLNLKKTGEFGVVEQVRHPLVTVKGLPGVCIGELVVFENGELGEAYILNDTSIEVLVLSKHPITTGMKAARTGEHLSIPVGEEFLGQVVDPLGNSLSFKKTKKPNERREIDIIAPGMDERSRITLPLATGVSVVDLMIPLGKGQKELVIGDRKSGKTSFLLTIIKNQVNEGAIAIYAAIAKRKSDIKKVQKFLKEEGIEDKTVVVASTSYDSPSLIYLTPFSAMTIAEYFKDAGRDVVLILDDLSTHSHFYREIALVAKRFPGRDAYPGDIFHTHARLLERAGNFKSKKGDVSITVFPVAEIIEGDLTGFIPTNLMGMTDGHIFFDSNIYFNGRRPAVNIALSVTRVGRQAQIDVVRSINRELTAFIANYEKIQNLSHFGAELTDTVKEILKTGDKIYDFFTQKLKTTLPLPVQLTMFGLLWLGELNDSSSEVLEAYAHNLKKAYLSDKKTFKQIMESKDFNGLLKYMSESRDKFLKICRTRAK